VKEIDEGRPLGAIRQDRSASYANGPGKTFVARGEAALESRDRRLYGFGRGAQFSAKLAEPITAKMAFHQLPAEALLKLSNATLDGGLVDAQRLRCRLHAVRASEGQEVPQVVPFQHPRSMQLCEANSQSFDCPRAVEGRSL
jgi:hypothetical protein